MPKIRPISDLTNNSRELARLELYYKLLETEENFANGDQGIEFSEFANQLRSKVHGANVE